MAAVAVVEPPWEGALAYKIDRSADGYAQPYEVTVRGPWDTEPDKVQWVDPASDLDCLIVRNHFGAWCGYVGVTDGHPAFGLPYSDDLLYDADVHGGLTYSDMCQAGDGLEEEEEEGEPSDGICHVPFPGRPAHVYWFGFDCAHSMDFSPGLTSMERRHFGPEGEDSARFQPTYRDINFVRDQVVNLASQLAHLGAGGMSD